MENVIKNNKRIAEFMGFEGQHEDWCGNNIIEWDDFIDENKLRPYNPHERWDDLIPVVEKIESIDKIEDPIYLIDIYYKTCKISTVNEEISWARGKTKIEAVYNAVVSFLEIMAKVKINQ